MTEIRSTVLFYCYNCCVQTLEYIHTLITTMNYDDMNEEELAAALDQQVRANTNLNTENTLLENFLNRNNAINTDFAEAARRDAKKKGRGGGGRRQSGENMSPGGDEEGKDGESPAKRRGNKGRNGPNNLSLIQKNDVATNESDSIGREIQEIRVRSEKLIDTLRSVIEETAIRLTDLKKDAYEFKRDIVVGAENFRTGKTMAEKVVRYMEEKLRQKDAMVEKLKLKNQT